METDLLAIGIAYGLVILTALGTAFALRGGPEAIEFRKKLRAGAKEELGLERMSYEGESFDVLTGSIDGFLVEVTSSHKTVSISIDGGTAIPNEISVQKNATLVIARFLTGDPELDEKVALAGPVAGLLWLFDETTRKDLASAVVELGLTIGMGGLRVSFRVDDAWDPKPVIERVRTLVALAKRLSASNDRFEAPERLSRMFERDPILEIRRRALEMLIERFRAAPDTERALKAALGDRDPEIQLRGAIALGARGLDKLLEMAAREDLADPLRVRAIEHASAQGHLFSARERARLIDAIDPLMSGGPSAARVAAFGALVSIGHDPGSERLLAAQEGAPSEVAAAIGRALAALHPGGSGRLSIAGGAEGAGGLSVARSEEQGALSVTRAAESAAKKQGES